jgi:nucleotide-binding universal stress UspA family protein
MFKKILVAIDCSEMSQLVFDRSLVLATATDASLMLLNVFSAFEDGYLYPATDTIYAPLHEDAVTHYSQQWQQAEAKGLKFLQSLAKQVRDVGIEVEFIQKLGAPGRVICGIAGTWGADLILVGRHGRTGVSELILGSVSNYVLHHAPCSVLVVQGETQREPEILREQQGAVVE